MIVSTFEHIAEPRKSESHVGRCCCETDEIGSVGHPEADGGIPDEARYAHRRKGG